jgi:hypothetical protein
MQAFRVKWTNDRKAVFLLLLSSLIKLFSKKSDILSLNHLKIG